MWENKCKVRFLKTDGMKCVSPITIRSAAYVASLQFTAPKNEQVFSCVSKGTSLFPVKLV